MNVYRRRFILAFNVELFFLFRNGNPCRLLKPRVDMEGIPSCVRLVIEGTVSLLGVRVGLSHQFDSFTTHLIISKLKM
jgi:hypothetical protein